jgi:hypothetical protein
MNAKDTLRGRVNHARDAPQGEGAFRDPPAGVEQLAEQRDRLQGLRTRDAQLAALEGRRVELEVDCIAADTALKSASFRPAPGLDQAQAAEIADALHKTREIEAALEALSGGKGGLTGGFSKQRERLLVGRDALISWIDAPKADRPLPVLKLAYAVVMIATFVVIWAAIFIHPILLLVLIGLGVVLTFLRSAEQNSAWTRFGAKRHFEEMGLQHPSSWEEAAVRNRLAELESQIEAGETHDTDAAKPEKDRQDDEGQLVEALMLAADHLDRLLAEVGLDADHLDPEFEQWLRLLSKARRARTELEQAIAKHSAIKAEKDAVQDALFQFLARQGEAPKGGSTEIDSLSAGLDRVTARSVGRHGRG